MRRGARKEVRGAAESPKVTLTVNWGNEEKRREGEWTERREKEIDILKVPVYLIKLNIIQSLWIVSMSLTRHVICALFLLVPGYKNILKQNVWLMTIK